MIRYRPFVGVLVTRQTMPLASTAVAEEIMSRLWRSVNVEPSVTTYCIVSTFVLSTVG